MPELKSLHSNAFRANAGAVIINGEGKVLAFEREDAPGTWQMPQGGIKVNEEPLDAVFREVEEETSLPKHALELVAEHPEWLAYEIPIEKRRGARGQAQKWFVLRLHGSTSTIDLENAHETEFIAWKWTTLQALMHEVANFKRPVYQKVFQAFAEHLAK